jgi:hypothetical protein
VVKESGRGRRLPEAATGNKGSKRDGAGLEGEGPWPWEGSPAMNAAYHSVAASTIHTGFGWRFGSFGHPRALGCEPLPAVHAQGWVQIMDCDSRQDRC